MNKDKIKEMIKTLSEENYKNIFAALLIYEEIDYLHDIEDLNDGDISYLEELYNKFMDSDITGLINNDIKELMEGND